MIKNTTPQTQQQNYLVENINTGFKHTINGNELQ